MTETTHHTDHLLKTHITDELAWSPNVEADHIGVSLNDGAVVLSGEVESYPEKAAAVRAVLRVHGVTAVADEIVVKHNVGPRDDADIAREASTALATLVVLPKHSVKATVHDHQLTLSGTVVWNFQREAAAHAVAGLPGVTAVRNDIALAPTSPFAATDAKVRIDAALLRNAQVDADSVHVTSTGSVVYLNGTVTSWVEFREAGRAAWATPGVTDVKNLLNVVS